MTQIFNFDRISRDTTHLVAAKLGTAKVNDARKLGHVKLVTPDWLWGCAERWEHIDERLYPLSKAATVTIKPPGKYLTKIDCTVTI